MVWGIWEFTEPHWSTENDILRITLPIARAGGRAVTWNAAILLISACKYFWTWVRTTPIHQGFPVDGIMPYYHRILALIIIVNGNIIHTIPQIINYATESLKIADTPVWLWGAGLATKQLLITGSLLVFTFTVFYVTTLNKVRKTTTGFRLFWVAHEIGIVMSYTLLFIHGTIRGTPILMYFCVGPLFLYTCDLIARRLLYVTREAEIVEISTHNDSEDDIGGEVGHGEKVVKLVIQPSSSNSFRYSPGQYADLKINSLSNFEWHPFTIASAPPPEGGDEKDLRVTFFIKVVGKWTNQLYEMALDHLQEQQRLQKRRSTEMQENEKEEALPPPKVELPKISVRGPFGAPAQNYLSYRHIVIIGSGIGVTPLLSVWQSLTQDSSKFRCEPVVDPTSGSKVIDIQNRSLKSSLRSSGGKPGFDGFDEDSAYETVVDDSELLESISEGWSINSVDVVSLVKRMTDSNATHSVRAHCAYVASILESMTVNICFFCLSVIIETVAVSIWLYELNRVSASIQLVMSALALVLFVSKILCSLVAYGPRRYCSSLVFLLEAGLVIMDGISLSTSIAFLESPSKGERIAYFAFFGAFLALHGVRIFHIFFATARPPCPETASNKEKVLHSVTGIWISRYTSTMSFAAETLIESMKSLPQIFALEFYATREKSEELVEESHAIRSGRPNWTHIFDQAIDAAHISNPEGEQVGVFFCGSPAIARELQRVARRQTAVHQHHTRKATGKSCHCRILVHKENF